MELPPHHKFICILESINRPFNPISSDKLSVTQQQSKCNLTHPAATKEQCADARQQNEKSTRRHCVSEPFLQNNSSLLKQVLFFFRNVGGEFVHELFTTFLLAELLLQRIEN